MHCYIATTVLDLEFSMRNTIRDFAQVILRFISLSSLQAQKSVNK